MISCLSVLPKFCRAPSYLPTFRPDMCSQFKLPGAQREPSFITRGQRVRAQENVAQAAARTRAVRRRSMHAHMSSMYDTGTPAKYTAKCERTPPSLANPQTPNLSLQASSRSRVLRLRARGATTPPGSRSGSARDRRANLRTPVLVRARAHPVSRATKAGRSWYGMYCTASKNTWDPAHRKPQPQPKCGLL